MGCSSTKEERVRQASPSVFKIDSSSLRKTNGFKYGTMIGSNVKIFFDLGSSSSTETRLPPIELPEVLSLLKELFRRTRSSEDDTLSWLVKRDDISELER